jgi:uroporphyrinogen-III synthase
MAALKQLGYEPLLNPMLKILSTGAALPAPAEYQGIVFTSASAIPFCPISDHPVFTVGKATAAAARQAGFYNVTCGGSDVAALESYLRQQTSLAGSRLLYPSAVDISKELGPFPEGEGPAIIRRPVYKTVPQPLQKTTIGHLYDGEIEWIVLFSRRTAEALGNAMTELDGVDWTLKTGLACLEPDIAEPLAGYRWRHVAVAAQPDQAALLACLTDDARMDGA